jgi:DNA-binding NtrC family response regulator
MHETFTPSASGQRVLIVDDEKTVRQTLSLIFKTHAYQTRDADSAEEALRLIGNWIPHVAIVDVGLPQMNGVELATLIRRQCPSCHILLFSGRPESGDLVNEAGTRGEVFEIAAKPVHPDFLLEWVGKCLAS